MICNKCGTEVTKNDKFCPKCGVEVLKGKKKKTEMPEVEEYKLKDKEIEKLSQSFVSKDEKYIASLGNGYIMNYLTNKSVQKGFAFLSNKRVYFKGSCLSGTGKNLVKTNEERTVDVKNITGSGFIYRRYWGVLIALLIPIFGSLAGGMNTILRTSLWLPGVMTKQAYQSEFNLLLKRILAPSATLLSWAFWIALVIICCKGFMTYLLKRKTMFRIEYAGGFIAFDVSFYAKAEIDDFQKQLRRVKDFAEETATIKTVAVETPIQAPTQNSLPDDLRKYADLWKEGLISQEEYDAMKKKILGL